MRTMNKLETKVFDEYKQWINSGNCQNCKNHDKELPSNRQRIGPISFFHIGKNFSDKTKPIRLCFVGKAAHSTKEGLEDEPFIDGVHDVTDFGEYAYENKPTRYWNFIRKITEKLGLTLDDLAITNLVKCNESDNITKTPDDITSDYYYEQCIKLFEKEIITLQPTHMVLFVNTGYNGNKYFHNHLLRDLSFGHSSYTDIHDEKYKKTIQKENGSFNTWWWHRNFSNGEMNLLRTRHPERAPLQLVDAIVEWVKSTK